MALAVPLCDAITPAVCRLWCLSHDVGRVTMGDAVVADAPQFKASTSGQSKTWAVAKAHVASFTGGKFQISGDGTVAAAACSDGVALLDLSNGQVKLRVQHAVAVRRVSWCRVLCLPNHMFALHTGGTPRGDHFLRSSPIPQREGRRNRHSQSQPAVAALGARVRCL